jgi:hypothetical protein
LSSGTIESLSGSNNTIIGSVANLSSATISNSCAIGTGAIATSSNGIFLGRSTEISRDEIKFNKFVERLRNRFAGLFLEALRVQCIFKGIIRADEWEDIAPEIKFDYREDNHFTELKDNEILQQRINAMQLLDPYIGKYYSIDYVRRNVLMQSDDDIKEIDKQIQDEEKLMIAHAEKQGAIQQAQQGEQE